MFSSARASLGFALLFLVTLAGFAQQPLEFLAAADYSFDASLYATYAKSGDFKMPACRT